MLLLAMQYINILRNFTRRQSYFLEMSNAVIKLSFYQTEYSRYSYSYVHRVFTLVFTELIDRTLRGQRTKSGTSTMTQHKSCFRKHCGLLKEQYKNEF